MMSVTTQQQPLETTTPSQHSSKPAAKGTFDGPHSNVQGEPAISNDIQPRYKLAATTFKALCAIPPAPSRRQVLYTACLATEFRLFPIKPAERNLLYDINDHTGIPYRVSESVTQPWHKVFLIVQADLQQKGWPNKISAAGRKELFSERGSMYRILDRALRCLVDVLGSRRDGTGVSVALDMLRSVAAQVWEGGPSELLQVKGLGTASLGKLVRAGVTTIRQLTGLEFYHVERLLSRNPPFGHNLLHLLAGFPQLTLETSFLGEHDDKLLSKPVQMIKVAMGYSNAETPAWGGGKKPWTTLIIEAADGRLLWFWRGGVKRLEGGKEVVIGVEAEKGEVLKVSFACEGIVGTVIRTELPI